jgi:dTDP-4-dehydrorhamnose reductase
MLGTDLMELLDSRYALTGIDLPEADICDRDNIVSIIKNSGPEIVIHTAAFTDVDGCELQESHAVAVNCEGTRNVAIGCKAAGAKMIYISTDYVFDGLKATAYDEDDQPNPMTVSGRTKLAGEKVVAEILDNYCIVRTGWLYGINGQSFLSQILRQANRQVESARVIKVVDDQFGSPTSTPELIKQLDLIISVGLSGIIHATCEGKASWFEFAHAIAREVPLDVPIEPRSSSDLGRPANRPLNATLENTRLKAHNNNVMRDWQSALGQFVSAHGTKLMAELGVN